MKEKLLKRISVGTMAELETKLMQAAESIDAGKGVDGRKALTRIGKRSNKQKNKR